MFVPKRIVEDRTDEYAVEYHVCPYDDDDECELSCYPDSDYPWMKVTFDPIRNRWSLAERDGMRTLIANQYEDATEAVAEAKKRIRTLFDNLVRGYERLESALGESEEPTHGMVRRDSRGEEE